MKQGHMHVTEDCRAVGELLGRIADKWSILVVQRLGTGPMRFNELRRGVGGISQKMLTTTLRSLERDGFLTRTQFATLPPRVDYELTELGRSLQRPICQLATWATDHVDTIHAAQARFDAAQDARAVA